MTEPRRVRRNYEAVLRALGIFAAIVLIAVILVEVFVSVVPSRPHFCIPSITCPS
jgi:hypothetical protein